MTKPKVVVVFSTTPSLQIAKKVAHALVEQKLAACVSIIPAIHSVYAWQGKVNDDTEFMLVIKTRKLHVPKVNDALKKLVGYEVPECIALDVVAGGAPYLRWVVSST